ncbi:hypothetical protein [Trinickia sp.]|uniref:hypothetical protein n=1 Tax=Trinickia sp. TaxID=2571163 RepID=UPI003F800617
MREQESVAIEEEQREFRTGGKVGVVIALIYAFVLYFLHDLFNLLDNVTGLTVEFDRDRVLLPIFSRVAVSPSAIAICLGPVAVIFLTLRRFARFWGLLAGFVLSVLVMIALLFGAYFAGLGLPCVGGCQRNLGVLWISPGYHVPINEEN